MTSSLSEISRRVHQPDEGLVRELATTDGDVVILGAGGKMGVSLSRMAAEAFSMLPGARRVVAVSRFTDDTARTELREAGVSTVAADITDEDALAGLPDGKNIIYMVGRKFGTSADSTATWALNTYLPGRIAQRYADSRIVAFSSGNVYPLVSLHSGGADESVDPDPVGEYAQSCLGREKVLTYQCAVKGTPLAIIRLNYAVDCRYGVLTDIARSVSDGRPVAGGLVNVVWQGDANRYVLSALAHTGTAPFVMNVTGPETVSTRWLATQLGHRLGHDPIWADGTDHDTALLSNAAKCFGLFGYPNVTLTQMLDWTAEWITGGGPLLDKPTHFAERKGRF